MQLASSKKSGAVALDALGAFSNLAFVWMMWLLCNVYFAVKTSTFSERLCIIVDMARPFYKFLGRMALMTAAALWTGCNDDSEKTAKSEKSQTAEAPATKAAANAAIETSAKIYRELTEAASHDAEQTFKRFNAENSVVSDFKKFQESLSRVLKSDSQIDRKIVESISNKYKTEKGEPRKIFIGGKAGLYTSQDELFPLGVPFKNTSQLSAGLFVVKYPFESDIKISPKGFLDIPSIVTVVHRRVPALRHIYRKFINRKGEFEGKVTLKMTVGPDGMVSNVALISSTILSIEMDEEIKKNVSCWRFPESDGSTTVTVPFEFYKSRKE